MSEDRDILDAHRKRVRRASSAQVRLLMVSLSEWCAELGFAEPARILGAEGVQATIESPLDDGFDRRAVYIVQPGDQQVVKVGVANDLLARTRELQISNPAELRILAAVPGGMRLELALHHAFAAYRVRGEWFRFTAPIVRLVELAWMPMAAWAQPYDNGEDEWEGRQRDDENFFDFLERLYPDKKHRVAPMRKAYAMLWAEPP